MDKERIHESYFERGRTNAKKVTASIACAVSLIGLVAGCESKEQIGSSVSQKKVVQNKNHSQDTDAAKNVCPSVPKAISKEIEEALQTDFYEYSAALAKKSGFMLTNKTDRSKVYNFGERKLGVEYGREQSLGYKTAGSNTSEVVKFASEVSRELYGFPVRLSTDADRELFSVYRINSFEENRFTPDEEISIKEGLSNFFSSLGRLPVDLVKKADVEEMVILDAASVELYGEEKKVGGMVVNNNVIGITDELLHHYAARDSDAVLHELSHVIDDKTCKGNENQDPEFAALQPRWLTEERRKAIAGNPNEEEKYQATKDFMVDPYGLENDVEDKAETLAWALDLGRGNALDYKITTEKTELMLGRIERISSGSGRYLAMRLNELTQQKLVSNHKQNH